MGRIIFKGLSLEIKHEVLIKDNAKNEPIKKFIGLILTRTLVTGSCLTPSHSDHAMHMDISHWHYVISLGAF